MKTLLALTTIAILAGATCTDPLLTGDREADRERIAQLEREARSVAEPGGCSDDAGCRSAPVGAKACGGPRDHLVYCPLTTDEPRLLQLLEALSEMERAYNAQYGAASDCAYVMPPEVECVDGTCRATGRPATSE